MGTIRHLLVAALALALTAGAPAARADEPIGAAEGFPTKCRVGEIATAKEGGAWFACFDPTDSGFKGRTSVGRVSPSGQVVEVGGNFPENAFPGKVVVAADGSFWMVLEPPPNFYRMESITPELARVTPGGETSVLPLSLDREEQISELVAAPNGYLWFVSAVPYLYKNVALWQVSPNGEVTRVPVSFLPGRLPELVVGAEGDVWFTGAGTGATKARFFRLAPGGAPVAVGAGIADSAGLRAPTPDGSIWFRDGKYGSDIGRLTPEGQVVDKVAGVDPNETSITGTVAGGDGSLWFGTHGSQRSAIGRVRPGGKLETFDRCLAFTQPYFGPERLVAGTEGDVWFTSVESRNLPHIADPPSIGEVGPDGRITQIYAGVDGEPRTIAADPEGGAWFASGRKEIEHVGPITGKVNGFYVGHFIRTRQDGRSLVTVWVPSAGKVRIKPLALHTGRGLRGRLRLHAKATTATVGCGIPRVQVRPVGPAARAFRKHGLAVETVAVTYTPRGGTPYTEEATLHLRRPRH